MTGSAMYTDHSERDETPLVILLWLPSFIAGLGEGSSRGGA